MVDDALGAACAAVAPPVSAAPPGHHLRGPVDLLPSLAEAANRLWGETPASRLQALTQLRRKMAILERDGVQGGSPGIGRAITFGRTDDQFLVAFLRARDFVVMDALRAIVRYTRFLDENAR